MIYFSLKKAMHQDIQKENNSEDKSMLFVYQSSSMKRLYQRYAVDLVLLDATYKTSKYSLPLYFLVVKTNVNYQVSNWLLIIFLFSETDKTTSWL